jgi:hypothetical protein
MSTQAPQLPKYTPPAGGMPPFISADPSQIESQAVSMDQQAYGLSDADFRQRYPQLYNSQQTFLNNLNTQMSGNINPQMQNVWMQSGLQNAVGATGNWSLGSGTTGMANIAKNLGLDQMQYQNQILNQFQMANDTFRPRTFGLSGGDTAQIALANLAGQNNWNQANYASQVQQSQYAEGLGAQQAVLNTNAANANTATTTGAITSGGSIAAVAAIAAFCWCAREAFGTDPRWKRFRVWLLHFAPDFARKLYGRHGRAAAGWLHTHPWCKPVVRAVMNLASKEVCTFPLWQSN